jgi:FAD:protein FMN transferase
MKETRLMMGMPITIEVADAAAEAKDLAAVFDYFDHIDRTFSTYKPDSEISRINRGELAEKDRSDDTAIVLALSEETKQRTGGFFDIKKPDGSIDPSGLVKGWAIWNAARRLESAGFKNFYVDAGGDIQTVGQNAEGKAWSIGIKNPFKQSEIVKTIFAKRNEGVATSGNYIRGDHIYNPKKNPGAGATPAGDVVSLTVVGPNIYEADRFATAAFAMGADGIHFIETLNAGGGDDARKFEAYMIDKNGTATMTSGLKKYL